MTNTKTVISYIIAIVSSLLFFAIIAKLTGLVAIGYTPLFLLLGLSLVLSYIWHRDLSRTKLKGTHVKFKYVDLDGVERDFPPAFDYLFSPRAYLMKKAYLTDKNEDERSE